MSKSHSCCRTILFIVCLGLFNWQVISGELGRVFENNPFFNGEFLPGINLPQGPVNDERPDGPIINVNYRPTISPTEPPVVTPFIPTIPTKPPPDELYKYCLHPRGTFQSRYCNAFVNCWDGNVVEQFCGKTLVFNPKGYCDYTWNVNCHGKPIKEIADVGTGGSNGWPIDGSYVPPAAPVGPSLPGKPIVDPILPPYRPPVTVRPPTTEPIFTIEPPGFPGAIQDPIYRPPPPIYFPNRDPPITIEPPGFPGEVQAPILPIPIHPPHHTTTTTQSPIVPIVPIFVPPGSDLLKYCLHPRGQFAGPNCHTFINCWDEVAIEQECPSGLHFNPSKHYCDFPYNVPCRHFKESTSFDYHLNKNGINDFPAAMENDLARIDVTLHNFARYLDEYPQLKNTFSMRNIRNSAMPMPTFDPSSGSDKEEVTNNRGDILDQDDFHLPNSDLVKIPSKSTLQGQSASRKITLRIKRFTLKFCN